jgi:hypothetical protein
VVTIAHISDPHVGSPYFVPNLMNRVIAELNQLQPDVVVVSGDLSQMLGMDKEFVEDDIAPFSKVLGAPSQRCAKPSEARPAAAPPRDGAGSGIFPGAIRFARQSAAQNED